MRLVSERRDPRRLAWVSATIALALVALLAFSARAQAAETLYWNNYGDDTLAFANVDGSGGGPLNLSGVALDGPEGMAYDSVTNRIYVASENGGPDGEIVYVNLDGSGAAVLATPGVTVNNPEGLVLDPATRTLYWVNGGATPEAIGWAKLDGSAAGLLNTTGAIVDSPYRLTLDPVAGRVYWGNVGGGSGISYANVDNSGGGDLSLAGATPPNDISGLAVVPSEGRIYWIDTNRVSYASLTGGGGGDLNLTGGVFNAPYGLSIDPVTGKVYWANYSNGENRIGAIGVGSLSGGGGGLNIATAPVDGPQDPLLLKSPTGTAAPEVTRNPKMRSELTCSQGAWAADLPGSFVYQAPRSIAYQWTRNGSPIGGATASTFVASTPGSYACTVTATNHTGSAAQASTAAKVKAAKVKLGVKKKAKAQPGQVVTFKVRAKNQGDLKTKKARVCVKLPKSAKGELTVKGPKCKPLGKVKAKGKKAAKLRVEVDPSAEGAYQLKFQVKGAPGKAVKSRIVVG
jgi:DNA-binding beta-propeller fold protein YncE